MFPFLSFFTDNKFFGVGHILQTGQFSGMSIIGIIHSLIETIHFKYDFSFCKYSKIKSQMTKDKFQINSKTPIQIPKLLNKTV